MRISLLRSLATAALVACAVGAAQAQALLQPPHGMRWGDSPEKLLDWAKRHAMDVQIRLPGDAPQLRVIRIEPRTGFVPEAPHVRAVEGHFLNGGMVELALHYSDADAPYEVMMTRFEDARRELTAAHGALTANRALRKVEEDGWVVRTRAFHREPIKGLFLLLTLTEVENPTPGRKSARFTVVYRNENFKAELERGRKR